MRSKLLQTKPLLVATGTPFKRVLVPLDGTQLAERALLFARKLVRLLKGDLILVRAATARPLYGDRAEALLKAAAEAEAYLDRKVDRYAMGYPVEVSVPFGEPATEILNVATLRQADLIVMTTHGRSGLSRLLRGSVVDELVRGTRLPLLLIRAGAALDQWERGLRRILVPLDGSELAESVLPRVEALAQTAMARLTLLQVIGPVMPELKAYEIAYLPEDDGILADQARAYLARVAAPLRERGLDVETRVAFGKPGDRIAAATTDNAYDLVAMATHGRGGIERAMVGSVADEVLRTASAPVLLFRGS